MIYVRAADVRVAEYYIKKEILKWCEQNCRAEWTKWPIWRPDFFGHYDDDDTYGLYYGFENPNEAMMFKLVWG